MFSNQSLSPLDVPEILENIFSYIDRYTITTTVVLFHLNHHRIHREVTWDMKWQPFETRHALAQLSGAERLELGFVQDGYHWQGPDVGRALSALHKPPERVALPLKRFHYSIEYRFIPDEDQEDEIMAVCPTSKEITVLSFYMTPRMVQWLTQWPVFLTTLDILQTHRVYYTKYGWLANCFDESSDFVPTAWHELLCKAPSLRYLKTLKMPFTTYYMDLYRRRDTYSED
ncbi:hypothetical protein FBU30_009318 [Linnemannia zychae]|nr:hypothetical protein FBU30_009318 [Linnemannia zychae]